MGSATSSLRLAAITALFALLSTSATALTCKHYDENMLLSNLRSNRCDQLDFERGTRSGLLADIASVLPAATQLTEVEISNVDLSPADCEAAAALLPRLDDLEVTHSRMSDSCAEALARSLATDPPLRELQLAGNALSVQGVGALMVALERNTHLRKLGLNGNALQDADVEPLVEYLEGTSARGTPPLHSLALKGNALSVNMQQRILQASASCTPAVRLDLRHQVPLGGGAPSSNGQSHRRLHEQQAEHMRQRHMQQESGAPPSGPHPELVRFAEAAAVHKATVDRGSGRGVPEGWRLAAGADASKGVVAAVEGVRRGVLPEGNPLQTWDESATAEWVASLNGGFSKYRRALIDAAVDFALLADLEEDMLREVGVGVTTHRQRILREAKKLVQAIRQQLAVGAATRQEL